MEFPTAGGRTLEGSLPIGVIVRGRARRHLLDEPSKLGFAIGVERDPRTAGWFTVRRLKVSEELLNIRERIGSP